jgi:hypothetical protein
MLVMSACAVLAGLEIFRMAAAIPVPVPPPADVRPVPDPAAASAQPVAAPPRPAPARPDSCTVRELTVRRQDLAIGAGVAYGRLVVTNTGRRVCTVQGYPVIEAVRAGHVALRSEPVPVPGGGPGPLIPLPPEQSASAAYRHTLARPPGCPRFERTQVVVPHTPVPFPLAGVDARACGYRVQALTGGAGATWNPS